jgi:hypothetical protein
MPFGFTPECLRGVFPASRWQGVMPLTAAAVSACQCRHGSRRQFLLWHSIRLDCRASLCGDRVASSIVGMMACEKASCRFREKVLDPRSGRTLVSLGRRFEAVGRREIQRLRRSLGNLSPDLLVDLAFKQSSDPYGANVRSRPYWRRKALRIMGTRNCFRYLNKISSGGLL